MVVLVSIDGLRPDAIAAAPMPNLLDLRSMARYTLGARTVMPSVTLPCHTSMVRGVDVPRHGITSNVFTPLARPVPSIFDLATRFGRRCGAFMNWGPLRDLYDPESVVTAQFQRDALRPEGDAWVVERFLAAPELDFAFVYLGHTDEAGHDFGWMSEGYLRAAAHADACLGRVLGTLGPLDTVLVLSDHGGHDRGHGTDMAEDMTIPWFLAGPGISAGEIPEQVRIFDTAPTLAAALGLPPLREWDGVSRIPSR